MNDQEENEEKEVKSEGETIDFTNPSFSFKPNGHHSYRQNGPYLVCKSCEITHATYIGMEKILVGFDEKDEPMLKDRVIVNG